MLIAFKFNPAPLLTRAILSMARKKKKSKSDATMSVRLGPRCPPDPPVEEYKAALAKECAAREIVSLGLPIEICGVPVNLMTLRAFIQLSHIKNPFLTGGRIGPEHVAQFLWRLSPLYQPPARAHARDRNTKRIRKSFVRSIAHIPYGDAIREINEYLDLYIFLDAPASSEGGQHRAPTVGFAASMIDIFGHNYGWTADATLDSALPLLYQLLKNIMRRRNPDCILINRLSDKVKADWGKQLEAWAKKQDQKSSSQSEPRLSEATGVSAGADVPQNVTAENTEAAENAKERTKHPQRSPRSRAKRAVKK